MERRSIPPAAPLDGAMELALQLALLRQRHGLGVLAVVSLDGRLLASAGDADSARAIGTFAQLVLGRATASSARTLHCGKMHLERVTLLDEPCVVAAMSDALIDDPGAIAAELGAYYDDARRPSGATPIAADAHAQDDDDALAWLDADFAG
jgi:hypothetical protein